MESGKATTAMKNMFNGMHSMTETGAISFCVGLKSFTLFNVFVVLFFCKIESVSVFVLTLLYISIVFLCFVSFQFN